MDRLKEIRARLAAASAGPWAPDLPDEVRPDGIWVHSIGDHEEPVATVPFRGRGGGNERADAQFIASAHEDLTWALEEIMRLRADLDQAHDAAGEWCLQARDAMRATGLDGDRMAELVRTMEDEMDFWRLEALRLRGYAEHRALDCTRTGTCICGLIDPTVGDPANQAPA